MDNKDLVLSDVHIYSCPPGQKEWSTRFYFCRPHDPYADNATSSSVKSSVNDIIRKIPNDGDLDVRRRPPRPFITIYHHLSTSLDDVALQVWRGSLLLTDWIFREERIWDRRGGRPPNVLELGAGVGLVSAIASRFCRSVICTDLHRGALALSEKNATSLFEQRPSFRQNKQAQVKKPFSSSSSWSKGRKRGRSSYDDGSSDEEDFQRHHRRHHRCNEIYEEPNGTGNYHGNESDENMIHRDQRLINLFDSTTKRTGSQDQKEQSAAYLPSTSLFRRIDWMDFAAYEPSRRTTERLGADEVVGALASPHLPLSPPSSCSKAPQSLEASTERTTHSQTADTNDANNDANDHTTTTTTNILVGAHKRLIPPSRQCKIRGNACVLINKNHDTSIEPTKNGSIKDNGINYKSANNNNIAISNTVSSITNDDSNRSECFGGRMKSKARGVRKDSRTRGERNEDLSSPSVCRSFKKEKNLDVQTDEPRISGADKHSLDTPQKKKRGTEEEHRVNDETVYDKKEERGQEVFSSFGLFDSDSDFDSNSDSSSPKRDDSKSPRRCLCTPRSIGSEETKHDPDPYGWTPADVQVLRDVDYIVAADVIYDETLTDAFCRCAAALLAFAGRGKLNRQRSSLEMETESVGIQNDDDDDDDGDAYAGERRRSETTAAVDGIRRSSGNDNGRAGSSSGGCRRSPRPKLIVSFERRYNFTMRDLEARAPAAEHFLSFVQEVEGNQQELLFKEEEERWAKEEEEGWAKEEEEGWAKDSLQGETGKPFFLGRRIRIGDIPQVLEYERSDDLELWELWLSDDPGAPESASARID